MILVIKLLYYGNLVLNFVIYLSINCDFRNKILSVFFCWCGLFYSYFGEVVINYWIVNFWIIVGVSLVVYNNDSIIDKNKNEF